MRIFVPKGRIGSSSPRKLRRALSSIRRKNERIAEHIERVGTTTWKAQAADRMRFKPTRLESILKTSLFLAVKDRFVIYQQWVEGGYILDFYIRELKLCFEADGPFHKVGYDARRDRHMAKRGIRTIRFNEKQLMDLDTVDMDIRREIQERVATLSRSGYTSGDT